MNEALLYVLGDPVRAANSPPKPDMPGDPGVLAWVQVILLVLGGILAISNLLVAKRPDMKHVVDRLVPFQALIGVGMLAVGIIMMLIIGPVWTFKIAGSGLAGISMFALIAVGIVLGFLFGMPQIAKWLPGQSTAEQKAMQIAQQLAAFQVLIGIVGLVAVAIILLIKAGILSPT